MMVLSESLGVASHFERDQTICWSRRTTPGGPGSTFCAAKGEVLPEDAGRELFAFGDSTYALKLSEWVDEGREAVAVFAAGGIAAGGPCFGPCDDGLICVSNTANSQYCAAHKGRKLVRGRLLFDETGGLFEDPWLSTSGPATVHSIDMRRVGGRTLINGVALEADEREIVYTQEFSTEPVEVSNRRLAGLQGDRTSSTALTGTERAGFAQLRILDTGEMNAAGEP